jgi:myo-inositol-1-phosphate synthase
VQVVSAAKAGKLPPDAPGLINPAIGPYGVDDIRFVAAFDVDERKVGKDLGQAVATKPNCTTIYFQPGQIGIEVRPGILEDGLEGELSHIIKPHKDCLGMSIDRISSCLRASGADVMVCYLPTGAKLAVRAYAYAAADAGVAFVNATPEPIANDPKTSDYFRSKGVVLLGDDVKSQLGATALHTALVAFCKSRRATVDQTYQLNVGGNTDFLNMLDPGRSKSKRVSKASALEAAGIDPTGSGAGPSGFIPHLNDNKVAYIHLAGRLLLGMAFSIELRLHVEDSPNSAGIIVDALRIAKCGQDRSFAGIMENVCPHLFKRATLKLSEHEAWALFCSALNDFGKANVGVLE